MSVAPTHLHRPIALGLSALALVVAGSLRDLDLSWQALILGLGVLLTGVPHGAVDHLRAAPALRRRYGARWLPMFIALYASLALAVAGLWLVWPVASLLTFLALSIFHFGTGDADDTIGVLAHGGAPILVPCVAYPESVAELFALLTRGASSAWAADLLAAGPWLVAAATGNLIALAWTRRRGPFGPVVELLAVVATGLWLPPLLSFGIYFCVWHAPRHMLHVSQELWPGPMRPALRRFARSALAMTAGAVLGGVALTAVLSTEFGMARPSLQLIFVGLAALTVPHLIVTELLRHQGRTVALRRWPGRTSLPASPGPHERDAGPT